MYRIQYVHMFCHTTDLQQINEFRTRSEYTCILSNIKFTILLVERKLFMGPACISQHIFKNTLRTELKIYKFLSNDVFWHTKCCIDLSIICEEGRG